MGYSSEQDKPDQGTYRAWILLGGGKQNTKTNEETNENCNCKL